MQVEASSMSKGHIPNLFTFCFVKDKLKYNI